MARDTRTGDVQERKLSIATVFGAINSIRKHLDKEEAYWLVRVAGECSAIRAGSATQKDGSTSEFNSFHGLFVWRNLDTGKEVQGSKAFFPKPAEDQLIAALAASEGATVRFVFDIGVVEDETTPVGYRYVLANPIPLANDNPVKSLLAAADDAVKALPAPAKKPAKAAA